MNQLYGGFGEEMASIACWEGKAQDDCRLYGRAKQNGKQQRQFYTQNKR